MEEKKKTLTRYVGIDLGKKTYEIAIVGKGGKVTRSNGSTSALGRQLLYKKLRGYDIVALEACSLAFVMVKEIETIVGCKVYVLNPGHLPLIYGSMKKTDKEDSLKLAHIIEYFPEEQLPLVPIPSEKEINRRKLLASYRCAQQNRNRAINKLHAKFLGQGITTKKKEDMATDEMRREAIKELTGIDREDAEYLVECLVMHEKRIADLDKQIEDESEGDEQIERLQGIPGVGPKVSFAFLAHVAAERFANASQVSNYLGLVPRVYMSGNTVKYGRITKRGSSYLRALLVQAAWALVRCKEGGKLQYRYYYMTVEKSISKKKAIVAIARRLAELMYTMLRDETEYESRPFIPKTMRVEEETPLAMCA